jgi:hypothetical protein
VLPLSSLDLEVVLSFAAVFWLHGWRRASADELIAVHAPIAGWWVREPFARAGPLILATWWPALIVSLVVAPDDREAAAPWQRDFDLAVARGRRRLARARWWVLGLRVLATVLIAWIVVGVPLAVAWFGVTGLVRSLLAALPLLALTSACTGLAMRRLGSHTRKAWIAAFEHIGPFSAVFAAESVLEQAFAGMRAPERLATVLGERRFLEWIRPWAFDARRDSSSHGGGEAAASLMAGIPIEVLDRSTRVIPRDGDVPASRFCPRCASAYRDSASACSACDGVLLVLAPEALREEGHAAAT